MVMRSSERELQEREARRQRLRQGECPECGKATIGPDGHMERRRPDKAWFHCYSCHTTYGISHETE